MTYCLLGMAGATSLLLPESLPVATAFPEPDLEVVRITGIVRDFRKTDAALNRTPSHGYGHYAGNLALWLDADERPIFTGAGFKVTQNWREKSNEPIAPHLFRNPNGIPRQVPVVTNSGTADKGTFDSWDSRNGPYGAANSGAEPTITAAARMPRVSIPLALQALPNQGNVSLQNGATIGSNLRCGTLTINGTVRITKSVDILCQNSLLLNTDAILDVQPNARVRIYVKGSASSWNHVMLNKNTRDPQRVIIYYLGTADFVIHNHAEVYANIVAPNAALMLDNHAELFGTFTGKTLKFNQHGSFHFDISPPRDNCDQETNDSAGLAGANSTGGIGTAAQFDTWYRDTLGTNVSAQHTIHLTRSSEGILEYLDDAFHPIDGLLFGNESQSHNHYFTFEFATTFTHHGCADTFFEFSGADDAWLFIDGELAMDLGGVLPRAKQHVDIDRLNLEDGQTYTLQFFYAQRQATAYGFNIRTNLDLRGERITQSVSASCD